MPEYICPNCRGGFPENQLSKRKYCPWCGQEMNRSYEGGPLTRTVVESDDEPPETLSDKLREWLKE